MFAVPMIQQKKPKPKPKPKPTSSSSTAKLIRSIFYIRGGSFASTIEFASLPINKSTLRALHEEFKYTHLSVPQSLFLPQILSDSSKDVFVKAGTGTGKTLGFLLPVIELIVAATKKTPRPRVDALILSPARELAMQTCTEAQKLIKFLNLSADVVIGGTSRAADLRRLTSRPPSILVATPGRLEDLMSDGTAARMLTADVKAVVLDEADRLLDMGFVHAIRRILGALPDSRRTLMFTATVTPEVIDVAKRFMRPGYGFIDTVAALDTHSQRERRKAQIRHTAVVAPPGQVHLALKTVLEQQRSEDPAGHKIMVFLPSNALVEFLSALFNDVYKIPVLMLTGNLPQNKRARATELFRTGRGVTLFASDVAGRGMDFPLVTCVVQMGVVRPDVYQQRVGRTGRASNQGLGIILLGEDERRVLETLSGLHAMEVSTVAERKSSRSAIALPPPIVKLASVAYKGLLGAYNSECKTLGWSKQQMVDAIAARFRGMGLAALPEISEKTLGKMGLRGVVMPR